MEVKDLGSEIIYYLWSRVPVPGLYTQVKFCRENNVAAAAASIYLFCMTKLFVNMKLYEIKHKFLTVCFLMQRSKVLRMDNESFDEVF